MTSVRSILAWTGISTFALMSGFNTAFAVKFPNGQTAFEQSPRLLKTTATNHAINTQATYRFTLKVPAGAGEALKAVRIEQRDNIETIKFRDQSSRAFAGQRTKRKAELSLASVGGEAEPGTVNVVFAKPVQPGETVTVSISPIRNPSRNNVFQFGVTAFPDGENGRGQFLGYGRIPFYSYR